MGGRILGYSSWQYGTPVLRDGDVFRLNEIADELIAALLPVQDKIAELAKAHQLETYLSSKGGFVTVRPAIKNRSAAKGDAQ